ncbi:PREDICTED: uncharacterized protein LOC107166851 isoform X2 [Diuraphis noxia]|uniref:uncharacterized protein LOC107166851 isoform X2 n=1 Tax=Diuraphis noxia TaxID=143948 RepID=UPI0007637DFB|nr:PREDICTED: uncharacterized protein LOC107166851 isoform X2 [Diuraphis noxia]
MVNTVVTRIAATAVKTYAATAPPGVGIWYITIYDSTATMMTGHILNRPSTLLRLFLSANVINSNGATTTLHDRFAVQIRHLHKKVKRSIPWVPPRSKFEGNAKAIASRGFLRPLKEYDPPLDIRNSIIKIANNTVNQTKASYSLSKNEKIRLLKKCEEVVDHQVPNSLLHTMNTLGDIFEFYETPIDTVVPYDALQNRELPPNLHILSNYHRFHPETDLMFDGVTAFPRSSNLVTGLKTKKKYKGFTTLSPYDYKN